MDPKQDSSGKRLPVRIRIKAPKGAERVLHTSGGRKMPREKFSGNGLRLATTQCLANLQVYLKTQGTGRQMPVGIRVRPSSMNERYLPESGRITLSRPNLSNIDKQFATIQRLLDIEIDPKRPSNGKCLPVRIRIRPPGVKDRCLPGSSDITLPEMHVSRTSVQLATIQRLLDPEMDQKIRTIKFSLSEFVYAHPGLMNDIYMGPVNLHC